MKCARVMEAGGQLRICFDQKEVWNIYELFHTRYSLHKRAYQHRVANAIEMMLTEALVLANDHVFLRGTNGAKVKMSDAIGDMEVSPRSLLFPLLCIIPSLSASPVWLVHCLSGGRYTLSVKCVCFVAYMG